MSGREPSGPPPAAGPAPLPGIVLAAVVLLALACRAPALADGFVNYDDPQVRAEAAAGGPVAFFTGPTYYAYKPVYLTSLWLDHVLFGDDPVGWHAGNWLLFALGAGLLALVVHALLRSAFLAGAAAALFAAHPVHTESVAWVAERKDTLSLAFVLLAHLAYRRARARSPAGTPLLAPLLLALGGLAKGTVWTWAGVIALDEALDPAAGPGRLRRLLPVLAVAVAGVGVDAWFGAHYGPGAVRHDATLAQLAAAMAGVHARYALSLLWPFGLSVDYPVDPAGSWADPASVAGLLLAVAAVAGLVVGLRRRRPVLALACGLWVLGLAPVNNLWPTTAILRADRYLLVPAVGAYLLAAAALARLRGGARPAVAALALALAVGAGLRAPVWADSQTLWTDAIAKQPSSAIARVNRARDAAERQAWVAVEADAAAGAANARRLRRPEIEVQARVLRATALVALGRADAALVEGREAVEEARGLTKSPWVRGDPREVLASAMTAVGRAHEALAQAAPDPGRAAEEVAAAVKAHGEATATWPGLFDAWFNLGNLLAARGGSARLEEAATALRHAVDLRPDDADAVGYLVLVLFQQGKDAEGKALYDTASRRLGAPRALRRVDAQLEAEVGDADKADRKLVDLLKEDPADDRTRALLLALRRRRASSLLAEARRTRDPEKSRAALAAFDRALEVRPGDAEAQVGAGDALLQTARFHEARERYGKARALDPSARWIANLEARAGALEAAHRLQAGETEEAARTMAAVVRLGPPRLDLGFAALEGEIPWLLPAAEAVEGPESADRTLAASLLAGAALLVGGDEDGARDTLSRAAGLFAALPAADTRLGRLYDGCHLLLAMVRQRRADVAGARRELEPVAGRRPGDPLVAYHLLLLDRQESEARRRIAEGTGDEAGAKAAVEATAAVGAKADALAATDPPWPGPGLLACEIDIEQGDFLSALRRLSAMAKRFPADASVRRGIAEVYEAQALRGGDRATLLGQAREALLEAKAVDPRDPRTALALSQLCRLLGDLPGAAAHAMAAASVEPIPGPAARALCTILTAMGRKALEGHELEKAQGLAAAAAQAYPSAAEPDLLRGDVALARQDLDAALEAMRAAREKEPADPDVLHALADLHRRRGGAYFLWRQRYPRPRGADGAPAPAAALAEWDEKNLRALRQAVAEFEEALRLEPDAPESETVRTHVARLKAQDPDAVALDVSAARKAYEEGETLRRDGHRADAVARYREAVRLWPEHFPAWMRLAEMAVELGEAYDVEGLRAVERLRDLDAERQYPEPELYAGQIWARRWKAESADPARAQAAADAARRARECLGRFLARADATSARGAENVARARRLLETLPKGE